MTRTRRTTAVALIAALGIIAATLGFASPAAAQEPTSVSITVEPSSPTEIGEAITFTATTTPSDVGGSVRFRDGTRPISGFIPVVDGEATAILNNFYTGDYEFNAYFQPGDPDNWDSSISTNVAHTVVPGDLPVMECIGGNEGIREILSNLEPLLPSGGIVVIETPITSHVLDTQPTGPSYPVAFEWNISIPDYLIEIASAFGAEDYLSLKDMDVAVEATGVATGEFNFPTTYPDSGYIPDPNLPIVFTASGSIAAETEGDIDFQMRPTGTMTVFVPEVNDVPADIDVVLDCTFQNTPVATTEVAGDKEVPVFSDVGPSDPFNAEINWMDLTGLSTGFADGTFRPGANITRQAMSAFIYRINGSPEGENPTCDEAPFPDVTVDNDFCGEIAWMAEVGITTGNPDGNFNPTGNVSRQAMAAFLYRSANPGETPPPCTEAPFTDVPTTNQFCAEISWMKATGISTGDPEGTYRPDSPVARQAMSAFLFRYTLVVPTEL